MEQIASSYCDNLEWFVVDIGPGKASNTEKDLGNNNKTDVLISLIVFTDNYNGHVWTFYTNGFSLHSNYIQIF